MSKVTFQFNDGRTKPMLERDAKILQALKRGSYVTRDMHADAPSPAKKKRSTKSAD